MIMILLSKPSLYGSNCFESPAPVEMLLIMEMTSINVLHYQIIEESDLVELRTGNVSQVNSVGDDV